MCDRKRINVLASSIRPVKIDNSSKLTCNRRIVHFVNSRQSIMRLIRFLNGTYICAGLVTFGHSTINMASKRKRNDLSLADKFEIVKLLDQKISQSEIGRKSGCSQSVVSRIAGKREEIRSQYETNCNPVRKRQRVGKAADVEIALSEWFEHARAKDIPLSGPLLQEKAQDLAKELGKDNFVATSGWLSRWKDRNAIVFKRLHGEKKDADEQGADHWIQNVLPEIISAYEENDIYNADETGLYYRAIPDGTLAHKYDKLSGSKKSKDRVTILLCCNMSGTDKREILLIGKSKQPRCFRGKTLPCRYENNANAWMTGIIFNSWLQDFNADMKKHHRKICLLLDNCSAHPRTLVGKLSNLKIVFLPPNTTSMIQPCDQGIIKNVKVHYRNQVVRRIIADIDTVENMSATKLARKLTLLDAIHMLMKAWRNVTQETIKNCFRKAGFQKSLQPENTDDLLPTSDIDAPIENFDEFVHHDDDLECYGTPSDADICAGFITDEKREATTSDEDDDVDSTATDAFTLPMEMHEARTLMSQLRQFLEERGCKDYSNFYALEDQIEDSVVRRQAKITEFINWIP